MAHSSEKVQRRNDELHDEQETYSSNHENLELPWMRDELTVPIQ